MVRSSVVASDSRVFRSVDYLVGFIGHVFTARTTVRAKVAWYVGGARVFRRSFGKSPISSLYVTLASNCAASRVSRELSAAI